MDYRVQSVISLMEKHLHGGWTAARFARCVNLSASRLHQLFREEIGLPPATYLRRLRMRRAKELLETTHLSVKEIMSRVGVADESHFVRDFKKAHGATPSRYRKLCLSRRACSAAAPDTSPPYAEPRPVGEAPVLVPRAAPPLLLRRPSHPRQFTDDAPAPLLSRRRRELMALLVERHSGFARLTAELGASIAGERNSAHPISYRPRLSTVPGRRPPAVERPRARPSFRARLTPGRGERIG